MSAVDVLAVMQEFAVANGSLEMGAASAAVAELIAADKAFDYCRARKIEADNRIVSGDRSDDAFRKQASAHHAYDRAEDCRRAALARVQGGA